MVAAVLTTLAVALGITYGWQPDPGSDAGEVQYIVQISPDQVGRLSQIGDITSTIDPSLRGRVSRIVIRVGDGPVPKINPAQSQMRSGLSGASASIRSLAMTGDHAPVPIPEMPLDHNRQASHPIAGINPASSSETSLMKPDPDGFDIPPSMAGAANEAKSAFSNAANNMLRESAQNAANQVGNELKQRGSSVIDDVRSAFGKGVGNPATTANPANSPRSIVPPPSPSLGGLTYAGTQAGGPSTDPSSRDATFQRYTNRGNLGQTATPSTGVFGVPNANTQLNSNAQYQSAQNQSAQNQNTQLQKTQFQKTQYQTAANGSTQPEVEGPQVPANWPYPTNLREDNRSLASDTFGRVPAALQNIPAQNDPRSSAQFQSQSNLSTPAAPPLLDRNARNQPTAAQALTQPDPSLDEDQLAAGGWSFVAGQLYDRYNRIISPEQVEERRQYRIYQAQQKQKYEWEQQQQRLASRNPQVSLGANSSQWASGAPAAPSPRSETIDPFGKAAIDHGPSQTGTSNLSDPRYDQRTDPRSPDYDARFAEAAAAERQRELLYERERYQNNLRDNRGLNRGVSLTSEDSELKSPSDRDDFTETDPEQLRDPSSTRTHSNQSLINGLLLFSGIANVYLFHLLRGIRVRYRDLVSSRRMTEIAA